MQKQKRKTCFPPMHRKKNRKADSVTTPSRLLSFFTSLPFSSVSVSDWSDSLKLCLHACLCDVRPDSLRLFCEVASDFAPIECTILAKAPVPCSVSSLKVPVSTMRPSAITTILATPSSCKKCSWLVTRIRVFSANAPKMHSSKMWAPTCASTAANGSSSKTSPPGWEAKTARAKATRAFWPPDNVKPFSPISVKSPAGRTSKSC
mmetsp:Transcript_26826/g.49363  ORF Transcript_26826/g.49363 Transcript_26826/m.49363 type:complete len:205 (-) Transcript_26826:1090-1704(-)